MKKRLIALLFYAIFWLLFFFVARIFFIATHYKAAFEFSFSTLAATFTHGILLDISATGYIFLFPVLAMIPGVYSKGEWFRILVKWYSYIIIIISSGIIVSDTLLYKYWGFRMDYTAFLYLDTPKEAAASLTTLQIAGVIAGIILLSSGFIILYRKFIDKLFGNPGGIRFRLPAVLFFMLFWGALIIPIRGAVGIAPINAGTVYFSEDTFVNHIAINVVWNVGSSVINNKPTKNPYQFGKLADEKAIVDTLTAGSEVPVKYLNTSRPDILLIVIESFGSALIGPLGGDPLTTPNFNRYVRDGILFTHFYSSGNRTDKAMPAIISGYPAQPAVSIMKEPKKTQSLPGIVKALDRLGYDCSFWYGGEINFANFNSYVINSGFRHIISRNNFSPEYYNAKWGVHDHVLFNALRDSMETVHRPFLKVVMTLSSHEPFDVPMAPVFEGNDDLTKFKNSIYYTDRSLGSFLDWARGTEWWKNTLVILLADHYRLTSNDDLVYSDNIFRIPMLWLGGALNTRGIKITKTSSQVDIPITLLHQMDLDGDYPFSKDILSPDSHSFAFYAFNEGFGFITDSSKYIYDHKLGAPVLEEGKDPEIAGREGKAYLQVLYNDFLGR